MSGIPSDAPIFRGIVCTDCGHKFDAARLLVGDAPDGRLFFCPNCRSDQIDYALARRRDLDDEPWPIPVRHLSPGEQRVMKRALLRSSKPANMLDEDGSPLPPRPYEPPGPPPRRRITFGRPMVIVGAIVLVVVVALCVLGTSDTRFAIGVG